jgi:Xaa-Pro dipeptidase
MSIRDGLDREALGQGLDAVGADGWLLFDFHGLNPVAARVLDISGLGTRRLFAWLPREGDPVAIVHRIEMQSLPGFPGRVVPYARWQELHAALRQVVAGKTVAMEISPEDAVPYLDRVPFGVVELVRSLGASVVPSAALVTRFAARWRPAEVAGHERAAELLAGIAREHLARATREAGSGLTESALQERVVAAIRDAGLVLTTLPIVAFGSSAADPHYEPVAGRDRVLEPDQVVLLDLWAGTGEGAVFADQTWMGWSGPRPAERAQLVWDTVRAARDAAIATVTEGAARGDPIPGFAVDRAARDVIEQAGFGEWFVHRTGHSIDRDLHGSGPHCDDYETHDDRLLVPGIGFSIEPGIYLPGEFGMRSEVNMYWGPQGPRVTPREIQRELITSTFTAP